MNKLDAENSDPMKKPLVYFKNSFIQNLIEKSGLIIFDLNGLIIDDEAIQLEAVNYALVKSGYSIVIDEDYWVNYCVGQRADKYFYKLIFKNEKSVNNTEDEIELLIDKKNEHYKDILKSKINSIIRPGFLDFINYLENKKKSSSLITAIATSAVKDEADAIIGNKGLNISKYFDYIITGSDIKKSKPDPEIYNKVVNLSKIESKKGLVFEDSKIGVKAAFRAGLKVIAVPNNFTKNQDFTKAIYIIDNFTINAEIIN